MRVVYTVLALCGACSSGAGSDSALGDPLPTCGSTFSDTFTDQSAPACGSWGTRISSSSIIITRESGTLHMLPDANAFAPYGGCESGPFDFTNGASVELVRIEHLAAIFELHVTGAGSTGASITAAPDASAAGLNLSFTDHTNGTTAPVHAPFNAPVWLRFQPQGPQSIVAHYSADHTTWQLLGADMYTAPPTQASITIRIDGHSADPAIWDNLNVVTCPP